MLIQYLLCQNGRDTIEVLIVCGSDLSARLPLVLYRLRRLPLHLRPVSRRQEAFSREVVPTIPHFLLRLKINRGRRRSV